MARLKRPDLPFGPLRDLNNALHDLHQRAGLPSVRDLTRSVGAGVASRSRIHDAFTGSRLPSWGLVQLLARALAQTVPAGDTAKEERDLHALWLIASGAAHVDHPIEEPTDPHPAVGARAILAMRVEWESPTMVEIGERRLLRQYVTSALQDTGYQDAAVYRHDGSAGSTVALAPTRERPSLTAATFLASVDFEHRRQTEKMRFMAHFTHSVGNSTHAGFGVEQAVAELESFCFSSLIEPHWPKGAEMPMYNRDRPVSAIVHGMDAGQIGEFWGGWTLVQVALRPGFRLANFWLREHAETPF
ncbi:hypothetical protein ACFC0C_36790 [Streptomyces sp. NPDC056178]|uniref:hypothetical protein n=1 Tax=unclassified Streptomyces TaxID=2593676 RepID=UPI0035DB92A1